MKRSMYLLITLVCIMTATAGLQASEDPEPLCTQPPAPDEMKADPVAELIIGGCCAGESDCPESDLVVLVACDCGYYCGGIGKPCSCTYRIK